MKRMRILSLILIAAAVFTFFSCDIIFYTPPDVSLTGPSSLLWNEVGTFDSGLTEEDVSADGLSFRWFLDGVEQDVSSSSYAVTFGQTPDVATDYVISVSVRAGNHDPVIDSLTVSIGGPAAFRIYNTSNIGIYTLYLDAAGTTAWGSQSDLLSTPVSALGGYSPTFLVQPGSYSFYALSQFGGTFWTNAAPITIEEGYRSTQECSGAGLTPSILPVDPLEVKSLNLSRQNTVKALQAK